MEPWDRLMKHCTKIERSSGKEIVAVTLKKYCQMGKVLNALGVSKENLVSAISLEIGYLIDVDNLVSVKVISLDKKMPDEHNHELLIVIETKRLHEWVCTVCDFRYMTKYKPSNLICCKEDCWSLVDEASEVKEVKW